MNRAYPGFYKWWQDVKRAPAEKDEARIPYQLWPQEQLPDRVPATPDPLDYGRVAAS